MINKMSKRTTFTTISPLPHGITRDVVTAFLHNHQEMIDLNPLVEERHPIRPPSHASPEEFHCTWYSLTDKISYLPGGLASGDVTYTCAFHDLPNGIQTHCYAPAGLNIRDKWTLNGSLPGEPVEPVELGIGAPLTGLYIREDVDMTCHFVMTGFVKRTLKKSHAALVERLKVKAQIAAAAEHNTRLASGSSSVGGGLSDRWSTGMASPAPSGSGGDGGQVVSPYRIPRYVPTASTGFQSPPPLQNQYRYQSFPSPPSQPSPPLYFSTASPPHQQYPSPSPTPSPPAHHSQVQPPSNLYPNPLRLRQNSSSSTSSNPRTETNSVYRDAQGRVTWSALTTRPSVRYRVAHPDYPQMNPYSDQVQTERHEIMGSVGMGKPSMGFAATLGGGFVAELEG